jgi:hypothetical protein
MSKMDELKGKLNILGDAIQNGPKRVKKAYDQSGLSDEGSLGDKSKLKNTGSDTRGAGCRRLIEPLPRYIRAECEKVIAGKNNTYIVFGRDRDKSKLSGYGGRGHTQAGAIDIVVGRLGSASPYKAKGKKVNAEPDFEKDSARIYISQKADIDEYFTLDPGPNTPTSETRAAIGMKADVIRIVARENIRLVTEAAGFNSMGGLHSTVGGIDLVAGNRDIAPFYDIQPLVKGKNLIHALKQLTDGVDQLRSTLVGFITHQQEFNAAVQNHTHNSPFFGLITSPSGQCMTQGLQTTVDVLQNSIMGLKNLGFNLEAFKTNYLSPSSVDPMADPDSEKPSPNYILSRTNGTN